MPPGSKSRKQKRISATNSKKNNSNPTRNNSKKWKQKRILTFYPFPKPIISFRFSTFFRYFAMENSLKNSNIHRKHLWKIVM